MELAAYLLVARTGFFDSWEYVTMEHPSLGFVPRPRAESLWSGVPIKIDRSGLRSRSTEGRVEPRQEGERLVLCVGDSNTFGNSIAFEKTYPMVLDSELRQRSNEAIRVINLGVPGHHSAQSLAWLESWLSLEPDVVVFADTFNNRVHWQHEILDRPHELEGRVIYLALLLRELRGKIRPQAVPLTRELPAPRIDNLGYREILEKLTARSRTSGFRLVLLATGDQPAIELWARGTLGDLRAKRWPRVLEQSAALREAAHNYYLPWYFEHRALLELGRDTEAEALRERYEASKTAGIYYLNRFVQFAQDHIAVMRQVAREQGLTFVDMRPVFRQHRVAFLDITHFDSDGHGLVADALADAILESGVRAPAN